MIVTSTSLLLTIAALSFLSFIVLDSKILNLLKTKSPDIYRDIGRPSLWVNMATKYSYWFSFILLGKFQTVDLPKATHKLCVINRVMLSTIILLVVTWVCYFT